MTPEMEEQLVAGIGSIKSTLEAQNKTLDGHTKALDAITYTLNGNGTPGLKTLVDRHDNTLTNLKRMWWIVATPVLAATGGGLVTGAVYLIHRIP